MGHYRKKVRKWVDISVKKAKNTFGKVKATLLPKIDKHPLASFFSFLVILLVLIVAGNFIRQPRKEEKAADMTPKTVDVVGIGQSPRVQMSAKIDKSGSIQIIAQASGVVSAIYKTEGDAMSRGDWVVSLASNYQGGNMASVQRQIAQKNAEFVETNYPTQLELLKKRKDAASLADSQSDKMRDITHQSIDETKNLISLNEQILASIDAQIAILEASNVGGANDSAILQAKQGKAGVLTGLNALKSGLRSTEYQAGDTNEPSRLSDVSREMTEKQLEIEERALNLNREISVLNLRIAQIGEGMMNPASPVAGTVERIYVNVGDLVNPGTMIASITGTNSTATAVVLAPKDIAQNVSRIEPSKLAIGEASIDLIPRYISKEPTDGGLHAILFTLPEAYEDKVANASYIPVALSISKQQSTASVPFVPIDAVYQTQTDAYVYVAVPHASGSLVAESRTIVLGQMVGSFVQVEKGLASGDQIIINRNIIAGDRITIQ